MKQKFQVTISFTMDDDFGQYLQGHRAMINELLETHVIEQYVVSLDSMTSWITINAYTDQGARDILNASPLAHYWDDMQVDTIFVYDSLAYRWPELSYN
jgi:hypothetical protein